MLTANAVNPWGDTSKHNRATTANAPQSAVTTIARLPSNEAARSGTSEKEKMPSHASANNRRQLYFDAPCLRAARSTGMPSCLKPTQARSPRR